jgi:hypothetical protein
MPENGKGELTFETYCDPIERELREALQDIASGQSVRSQTTLPVSFSRRYRKIGV